MKTFEEKLRSMTAKQIIQAMIDGLNREWVMIEMHTFGENRNGVCFGCAATNTICEINQQPFFKEYIYYRSNRGEFLDWSYSELTAFEQAIDNLRSGNLKVCNMFLGQLNLPKIKNPNIIYLPMLYTEDWKENIHLYQQLADDQD